MRTPDPASGLLISTTESPVVNYISDPRFITTSEYLYVWTLMYLDTIYA